MPVNFPWSPSVLSHGGAGKAFLGGMREEHQDHMQRVYIPSRVLQRVKALPAAQLKQQAPILNNSNIGRCRRQMITLVTTAKELIHTAWGKAMVNHVCTFIDKPTWIVNIKWVPLRSGGSPAFNITVNQFYNPTTDTEEEEEVVEVYDEFSLK